MDSTLRITDSALADLDALLAEMARRAGTLVAARWLDGLERTLIHASEAREPAPEAADVDFAPRQIEYRGFRIVLAGDPAVVLRVYRGNEASLTLNLLPGAA